MSNPLFNNDWLITDTGAVDHEFIKVSAEARAKSRYGADCRPGDITDWIEKLTGMADALAARFAASGLTTRTRRAA